jgi:hypothetical protein
MMMKKKISALFGLIVFLGGSLFSGALTEFSAEKAKRVDRTLKRIAMKKKHKVFLKKITFSEDELNSYLNLIYSKRYTPEVKYIKLKLKKNNYVSGTVKVKLVGKKYSSVPSFLKDIEVDLSGKIECQNYRMRYEFDNIRVNGTSFSPEVLDEAFGAAQANFKVKKSMYDWFQLMPGIKNVVVDYKKVTLFY